MNLIYLIIFGLIFNGLYASELNSIKKEEPAPKNTSASEGKVQKPVTKTIKDKTNLSVDKSPHNESIENISNLFEPLEDLQSPISNSLQKNNDQKKGIPQFSFLAFIKKNSEETFAAISYKERTYMLKPNMKFKISDNNFSWQLQVKSISSEYVEIFEETSQHSIIVN
ncbi:MAG: hypothetical protein MK132_17030 [Lentisphaerales bacterium]|nr:hypothetical protein [Lentisphaerales bacterium]